MFNLLSRSVDYPLHSLLGFDIHKVPLDAFAQKEPSLTLVSELFTTGEAQLSLTKNDNSPDVPKNGQSIEDLSHDVERLLYLSNYHVSLKALKVHAIDEELKNILSEDRMSVLNGRHVFLENTISSMPQDIYNYVFDIQLKNLVPVISFPGKDPHFFSKSHRVSSLEDRGCVFHIDLFSLTGANGQEAKKITCSLLQSNRVHFVSFPLNQLAEIKKNKGIRISRKIADLLDEQLFISLPPL